MKVPSSPGGKKNDCPKTGKSNDASLPEEKKLNAAFTPIKGNVAGVTSHGVVTNCDGPKNITIVQLLASAANDVLAGERHT